ncbi:hypothetical protein IFM89_006844 [Coptis chinensis]|uniref:Major facilitator superfamily (MFS) profile domain-containing protein n=1 Tax=Coptis chinensis TaxID=261450 RepID=A0A835HTQ0_9MAGN|nr:hypothetical protein IFM89_006844 [Coptis chinensis]
MDSIKREESGNVAGTSADKQKIEENGVPVKALLPLAQWNVVKAQYDAYVHSLHAELDAAEAARDAAVEAAKAAVAALDASHSHLIMAQIALDETEGKVKVVQGEVTNLGGVPLADSLLFLQGTLALDIGRLATGYGMGVFSYVVPVFIAEIAPKNLRGGLTTLNQLMICSGVSLSFIIGTVLQWRTLALIGLIPCIILLVGLFFIPESPRWLAKIGRSKEFEVALQKLRGKDADITVEAAEIQDYIDTLERLPKSGMLDLFQRRYLRSVMIGVGLMVCQQFGGINGICFYTSEIFASAGFPSNIGAITYACLQVVVTAIGASLIDRAGRRVLLLTSGTGLVVGCLIAALSFYLKSHELSLEAVPALAVTGILVYIGSFSIGMGAVPWVVMSEIFPINVKGAAGSLATLVNWFGSWLCSFTFNYLMSWSSYVNYKINWTYNQFCGLQVGYASPTQTAIREDLHLSLGEALRTSVVFCLAGWLSIYFAKAKIGRSKEFEAALQKLRGKDADITIEAAEIQDYIDTLERLPKAKILDLFQRRYLPSVIVSYPTSTCYTGQGKTDLHTPVNPLTYSHTQFPPMRVLSTPSFPKHITEGPLLGPVVFYQPHHLFLFLYFMGFPPDIGTTIYSCLQIVVVALGAALIDKAGRRVLLLTSATGSVIGCLLTGLSFYMKTHELAVEAVPALAVTGIMVYIGSGGIGMGAVPWIIMSEVTIIV